MPVAIIIIILHFRELYIVSCALCNLTSFPDSGLDEVLLGWEGGAEGCMEERGQAGKSLQVIPGERGRYTGERIEVMNEEESEVIRT